MSYQEGYNLTNNESHSSTDSNPDLYSPYSSNASVSSFYFGSSTSSVVSDVNDTSFQADIATDPFIWNNRFQEALSAVKELEHKIIAHRARIRVWQKLSAVASDFLQAAKTYGKIIISEVYLPASEKTIKPLSGRGIAGGEKYIVNSIMFKFAIDNSNLFGGDDYKASRVAGHDLLGLNCFLASNVEGVHTPLVCLLDYRGFRLVALSLLPIDRSSLVYGSDDAGNHIVTDDEVHEKLLKCAKSMNTAEHEVLELSTLRPKVLATAIDIEAHRSPVDGRTYVIDCSRAMPPSAVCRDPRYRGQCNHLTMLLRPELVKNFPTPLNSDAYSSILLPRNLLLRKIQEAARREERLNSQIEKANQNSSQETKTTGKSAYDMIEEAAHTVEEGQHREEPSSHDQSITHAHTHQAVHSSPQHVENRTPRLEHPDKSRPDAIQRHRESDHLEDEYDTHLELPINAGSSYDTSCMHGYGYTSAPTETVTLPGFGPQPESSFSHPVETPTAAELNQLFERMRDTKYKTEESISEATNQLLQVIIPKFAESLQHMMNGLPPIQQSIFAYDWLVVWLHWHGINIRHLGTLRTHIPHDNPSLRALLLCIMLSRVLKNMGNHRLRMEMRRLKYAGEFPYQQCLVEFLNLVFGTSEESLVFWNSHLKSALLYQFPDALNSDERKMDFKVFVMDSAIVSANRASNRSEKQDRNPNSGVGSGAAAKKASDKSNSQKAQSDLPTEPVCFLFFKYCRLVGLKLKAGHSESFASNPALFNVAEPLNVLDLDGLPDRAKTLQLVSHAEGLVWKVRGEAASTLSKSKQFAYDLWTLALSCYKESLLANPRDQRTIRNVAEVYHSLGFPELAGIFAHLAIETNPNDAVSLYKYAIYLYSTTKNEETAKRYFEAAIRTSSATPGAFLAYAEYSLKLGRSAFALTLVEQCLNLFPGSWDAAHKMAYLQHFVIKDYEKAHIYYKQALELENKDLVLLNHYTIFLREIIKDESLARSYELLVKKLEQKTTIAGRGSKLWDASYLANSPIASPAPARNMQTL